MDVRHIPEQVVEGRRLGRHVRHDPRSLQYLYPAHEVAGLRSVKHVRHIPVLDQGSLGSCTGNAAEGCVGTAGFLDVVPDSNKAKPTNNAVSDEDQAVALYSAATKLDDAPGSYPPDDTGSDGLSVAKAAKAAGLISGYQHCTSLDSALKALSQQPVITGVNWYSSFDEPDANGLVTITPDAYVRGGHEFVLDELDVDRKLVGFTNSWGAGWGVNGRAYMSWADFGRLLSEQGDVTVFVPLSQPAPTPTPPQPVPTPQPDPHSLLAELATLIRAAEAGVEKSWHEVMVWLRSHGL